MTTDDDMRICVQRYRASVAEVATPSLDQKILQAATRQALKRRLTRRAGGVSVLTAVTALCAGVVWHTHRARPSGSVVTNYGQIEGSTRAYLLRAGQPGFSGPGLEEGKP
jgi:ferric-dicitrate binding protein FerR (iron transport regulator)